MGGTYPMIAKASSILPHKEKTHFALGLSSDSKISPAPEPLMVRSLAASECGVAQNSFVGASPSRTCRSRSPSAERVESSQALRHLESVPHPRARPFSSSGACQADLCGQASVCTLQTSSPSASPKLLAPGMITDPIANAPFSALVFGSASLIAQGSQPPQPPGQERNILSSAVTFPPAPRILSALQRPMPCQGVAPPGVIVEPIANQGPSHSFSDHHTVDAAGSRTCGPLPRQQCAPVLHMVPGSSFERVISKSCHCESTSPEFSAAARGQASTKRQTSPTDQAIGLAAVPMTSVSVTPLWRSRSASEEVSDHTQISVQQCDTGLYVPNVSTCFGHCTPTALSHQLRPSLLRTVQPYAGSQRSNTPSFSKRCDAAATSIANVPDAGLDRSTSPCLLRRGDAATSSSANVSLLRRLNMHSAQPSIARQSKTASVESSAESLPVPASSERHVSASRRLQKDTSPVRGRIKVHVKVRIPANQYSGDPSDPMDMMLSRCLLSLDKDSSSRLRIRRRSVGRYEIDGRLVCLRWCGQELFAREEEIADTWGTEVPLMAYMSQVAHVCNSLNRGSASLGMLSKIPHEERLSFVEQLEFTRSAALATSCQERRESMRLAVEEAALRERAALAHEFATASSTS